MRSARIAWSLWAVALSLVVGAHVLRLASRTSLYGYWLEDTLISAAFATLGALIVSRRPGNVIGWLFLVIPVAAGLQFFSGQYATVALPGGAYAAWLSVMMQSASVFTIPFLIMLFPTGRLLSPRWRVMVWAYGLLIVFGLISLAIHPGSIQEFAPAQNPFGVEAVTSIPGLLHTVTSWAVVGCLLAIILSLVLRLYRSRSEERLQLKWFVYAATVGVMAILLIGLAPAVSGGWLGRLVWTVAPLSLPVSAGIAILQYRLYDIDLIIRKTAIYGALTVSLALVYLGGVAGLQSLLSPVVGDSNQLAIVASTLTMAALFNPLRRRIQTTIDRRFYRSRYDAKATLEAFSARLRTETDLDALTGDLVAVARQTLQPEHASLWLRPPEKGGRTFQKFSL